MKKKKKPRATKATKDKTKAEVAGVETVVKKRGRPRKKKDV